MVLKRKKLRAIVSKFNIYGLIAVLIITGLRGYAEVSYTTGNTPRTKNFARIAVQVDSFKVNDSLELIYWPQILGSYRSGLANNHIPQRKVTAVINAKGKCVFNVTELNKPVYFSLLRKGSSDMFNMPVTFLEKYLLSPSDDILIRFVNANNPLKSISGLYHKVPMDRPISYLTENIRKELLFSGIGVAKYRLRYLVDQFVVDNIILKRDSLDNIQINSDGNYNKNNFIDSCLLFSLNELELLKHKMSKLEYEILKLDYISSVAVYQYKCLTLLNRRGSPELREKYKKVFDSLSIVNSLNVNLNFSEAKKISIYYSTYEIEKASLLKDFYYKKDSSITILSLIKKIPIDQIRERCLTLYILSNGYKISNLKAEYAYVESTFHTSFYKYFLKGLISANSVGSMAYNFSLPDDKGVFKRLSDYKGRVVFIDFWYTGCTNCKLFFKKCVSIVEEKFRENDDVVFITISIDKGKGTWINSIKSGIYTSSAATNLYTNGLGVEDAVIQYYKVFSYPFPMLINREGIIDISSNFPRDPDKMTDAINSLLKTRNN